MERLYQEYILSIKFKQLIEREELLISKYKEYENSAKERELKDLIKEYEQDSQEHIKMLKDKMIKLNVQG